MRPTADGARNSMTDLRQSGFHMEWGQGVGSMWIRMTMPNSFLRQFSSPGDVMMQFLVAAQARGINIAATDSLRTRIGHGVTTVEWVGTAHGGVELMPALVKELTGGDEHG
jgi:hypothetical protein